MIFLCVSADVDNGEHGVAGKARLDCLVERGGTYNAVGCAIVVKEDSVAGRGAGGGGKRREGCAGGRDDGSIGSYGGRSASNSSGGIGGNGC